MHFTSKYVWMQRSWSFLIEFVLYKCGFLQAPTEENGKSDSSSGSTRFECIVVLNTTALYSIPKYI